jgi:alpha-D-xyloside xylohydrolase
MRLLRWIVLAGLMVAHASPAAALTPGNAWHLPSAAEPGIASMRSPLHGIAAGADIVIYSGNQFAGTGGNPGNQLQTGSALLFRKLDDAAWTTVPMTFSAQAGNNKYFSATIPGAALAGGDVVEYYLQIAYSDHATTFVYGNDDASHTTIDEATARAGAYAFAVERPLAPVGAFASYDGGAWQARIYTDSGHLGLVATGGTEIELAPPAAKVDGNWLPIGRVVAQTALPNGLELHQALGRRTIVAHLTFAADGVMRYEVVDWGGTLPSETQVVAASDPSEHFYGFGEKFDGLDQAGKIVRILTSDIAGDKGDHSYLVAPWFVSSRGYGFHLDSTAESQFDLRATAADRFSADLKFHTLAVNLVGGPTMLDVIGRYTGYTGRPALPPPWVFGPWISSDAWRDGGEVRYVVTKMLDEHIPASVFVFDSPWEVAYNDFAWNATQFASGGTYDGQHYDGFASVADMMAFLKHHGLKVVVWMTPFVNVRSNDEGIAGQNLGRAASYDAAAAAGYFVRSSPGGPPLVATWWKGDGSPIDFTNPAARTWIKAQLQQLVDASGGVIGGFKTDDGEADYIPLTASYADGRTGVEMKNGYCVEYLKTVWSVLGADGIVFARSGFTGSQAFPAVWAGDNEPNFGAGNGLPSVVSAGLSAAMSGYAIWGSDIGGYQDVNPSTAPEDLFMRWTQFGALSPVMQLHRQIQSGHQYPWSYGQAALDNYRAYAQLHTALFPYLYTSAKQASSDGTPILRPLPLVDPTAPVTADEYMLGPELLVAPVLAPSTITRPVYLPAGTGWFDYWTGQHLDGGQTVTWTGADATQLPLYVRDGAIVPRISDDVQSLNDASYVDDPTVRTPDGALQFSIYPSASSHVTVYDGTDVTCTATAGKTTIELVSVARAIAFEVYSTAHPTAVTRDGAPIPELPLDQLATATDGWAYDGMFVRIQIAHAGGVSELVLDGTAQPTVEPEPPAAGCGCATRPFGPGDAAGWLLVVVVGWMWLARRRWPLSR